HAHRPARTAVVPPRKRSQAIVRALVRPSPGRRGRAAGDEPWHQSGALRGGRAARDHAVRGDRDGEPADVLLRRRDGGQRHGAERREHVVVGHDRQVLGHARAALQREAEQRDGVVVGVHHDGGGAGGEAVVEDRLQGGVAPRQVVLLDEEPHGREGGPELPVRGDRALEPGHEVHRRRRARAHGQRHPLVSLAGEVVERHLDAGLVLGAHVVDGQHVALALDEHHGLVEGREPRGQTLVRRPRRGDEQAVHAGPAQALDDAALLGLVVVRRREHEPDARLARGLPCPGEDLLEVPVPRRHDDAEHAAPVAVVLRRGDEHAAAVHALQLALPREGRDVAARGDQRDVEPLGDLDHAHGPVQPQLGEDGGAAADDQLPFARGHVASSRSTGRRPLCRLPGGRAGRGERTDHKRSPSVDARGSRREDQVMTTPWPAAWGPAPAPDDRTSPLTGYTREHWVAAADGLLHAAARYASPGGARIPLPGPPSWNGPDCDGLEGYARTFLLLGWRLSGTGEADDELVERYTAGLVAGTDPGRPEARPRITR